MRVFECQNCGQLLYFENTSCERCGKRLGFLPRETTLSALDEEGGAWRAMAAPDRRLESCANAEAGGCNWLLAEANPSSFCQACRHNRTIPDLSDPLNLDRWRRIERAKRHLFYSLLRLGLPLRTREEDPEEGLAFDFLADQVDASGAVTKVMTGHATGVITLSLAEADDAERERRRTDMGEPYRTLLGHLRHEVGHYYWDRLVRDRPQALERFRGIFGDDRRDYGAALKAHYDQGPPADWQDRHVSAYAAAHPWEDWAETWAHYLHVVDTLETARSFGLTVRPRISGGADLQAEVPFDPYRSGGIGRLIEAWLPIAYAMNSLSRSMGHADLYPFVLSPEVIVKMGFVDDLVRGG